MLCEKAADADTPSEVDKQLINVKITVQIFWRPRDSIALRSARLAESFPRVLLFWFWGSATFTPLSKLSFVPVFFAVL